jgi:hypothetical protein
MVRERQDVPYDRKKDIWVVVCCAPLMVGQLLFMGISPPDFRFYAVAFAVVALGLWGDWRLGKRRTAAAYRVGLSLGLCVVIAGLAVGMGGLSMMRMAMLSSVALAIVGGMSLAMWGWRGRVDASPRCASCGYETGELDRLPEQCPECGELWLVPGGIAFERNVRRPWVAAAGAAVAVLAFAMIMPGHGLTARAMPTPLLISSVRQAQWIDDHVWGQLQKRSLSPERQVALAEALLDRRLAGMTFYGAPGAWLDGIADSLPPELRRRYYMEMADLSLARQDGGRVDLVPRSRGSSVINFVYYVRGPVEVDGVERLPAADEMMPTWSSGGDSIALVDIPRGEWATVRASVWVVIVPMAQVRMPRQVQWSEDGLPQLAPGAVWVEKVELEMEVGG